MGTQLPLPQRGTAFQFSANNCCGQMAGWIKVSLGMEIDFRPGDFVLDGNPAPLPKRGRSPSPIFGQCPLWPNGWMDQDSTWHGGGPWSRPHCVRWGPSSPPKEGAEPPPQFSAYFYCSQTVGCIKMPHTMEVGLSPGDFVLDGDPAPSSKGWSPSPILRIEVENLEIGSEVWGTSGYS